MPYSESDTRAKLIDPAMHQRGWTEDLIRREETAGSIEIGDHGPQRKKHGRVDYVLRIKVNSDSQPVAVALIEAKAEKLPPGHGLEQGKLYATACKRMNVPFVFSSNGHQFVEYDKFTGHTSKPQPMDSFPSPAELRPVSGSSMSDLDYRRLRDYFQRVRQQDFPAVDSENDEEKEKAQEELRNLLINTELLVESDGVSSVTLAAILLFGKNPNRFLPYSGIDAFSFPGKEKEYSRKDSSTIRGPLVFLGGSKGVVEKGVIEMTVDFIKKILTFHLLLKTVQDVVTMQIIPMRFYEKW